MITIKLQKNHYSESVIRKSLYWCDPDALWTLDLHDNYWVISVKEPAPVFEATLHKHLNDFLLREQISAKTHLLREALIHASLQAVMRNVSKA